MKQGPALTLERHEVPRLREEVREFSDRPEIDGLLFDLTFRAGLRGCEVAGLMVDAVLDARGNLSDEMRITVTKRHRCRVLAMHPEIRDSLREFFTYHPNARWFAISPRDGRQMSRAAIGMHFKRIYERLGYIGCTGHSGRATCLTELAQRAGEFGCSLYDVMKFAGHKHLSSTEKYLRPSEQSRELIRALGRMPNQQSFQQQGRTNHGAQARRRNNRKDPAALRQSLRHEGWIAEQLGRSRV